jgi:tRNA (adenine37-N6)-methyltransferase
VTDATYTLNPIGHVAGGEGGFTLRIDEQYREALLGLEGFSHINVLFWCHYLDTREYREITVGDKPYKQGPDQVGIFATRSPARPNPIALTAVPVLDIDYETGVIQIAFIDAEPDSPVLDIKPFSRSTASALSQPRSGVRIGRNGTRMQPPSTGPPSSRMRARTRVKRDGQRSPAV